MNKDRRTTGTPSGEISLEKLEKRVEEAKIAAGMAMTDARLAADKVERALEDFEEFYALKPELEDQLAENKENLQQIQQKINENASRLAELLQKLENNTEKDSQLENRIAKTEEELKGIASQVKSNALKEIESLAKEFAALKAKMPVLEKGEKFWAKIEEATSDAKGALNLAKESAKEAKKITEQFNQNYQSLFSRIDEYRDKINVAVKLADHLDEKFKSLTGAMTQVKTEPEPVKLDFEINDILRVMIKHKASDLHLKAGSPPTVRLEGELLPIGEKPLTPEECHALVFSILNPTQKQKFMAGQEVNLAYSLPEARFRVNAFWQNGVPSAAFRMLLWDIPSFSALNLPPVLEKICQLNRGLVLVTGPAGCGKSTTLASIIDYINRNKKQHIITIEDPIEYVHQDKSSIVTQREVGVDTTNFEEALKQALRQDPNIILIGEMRDAETIMTAVIAAETGHLVLSTLHTPNTIQAIDRIIETFAGDQQQQFRLLLSNNLKAVVSQKLLNRTDGEGRVPAVEVMTVTPTIASLIFEGNTKEIYQYIVQGQSEGMQTFTSALTRLFEAGLITKEEALYHADQPTEFRLNVEGHVTSGAAGVAEDSSLMSWL